MAGQLPADPRPWPERRNQGLSDQVMRQTIGYVTRRLHDAQVQVFSTYDRAEITRQRAILAKRRAIDRLDQLIPLVTQQISAHGGQVIVTQTAQEAVDQVLAISRRHQVQRVIKTKSMVTEELELNRALEAAGIEVRETDLGEYIIQLAQEKPSHILAPAAHRNRQQIQVLLDRDAQAHNQPSPASDQPRDLTQYARLRLRQEFLSADMGITGGNILVAETGTLVIITNEGNADMVTSLPRVLVSVVGIEKIVERWDDLYDLIQQPALNGVGQRLSSYTTLVSGPRQGKMADGPEAWYVVLVDNGRRALKGTPYQDVLSCIRCGACLNACPVFRQIGGHAYGTVYSGPIGIVETPLLTDLNVLPELPSVACTLCYACQEACPMDIELPHHIVQLRREKVRRHLTVWSTDQSYRWWARLWKTPHGYRRSIQLARALQRGFMKNGRLVRAPGLASGWFMTRDMPPVAPQTFREWWQGGRRESGNPVL